MTIRTARRHIANAHAALAVEGRKNRREACLAALMTLNACAGGMWELGLADAADDVARSLRAELAWMDECTAARGAHVPAPLTGFAAELAIASAMNEAARR